MYVQASEMAAGCEARYRHVIVLHISFRNVGCLLPLGSIESFVPSGGV